MSTLTRRLAPTADLQAVAQLAELDAVVQRDAKVRERYLALAKRARDAG